MTPLRRLPAVVIALFIVVGGFAPSPARSADYLKGLSAYKKGEYGAAMNEWRPLAEQGNAFAQHNLGWFHEKGLGVPKDDKMAVKWYTRAAEQGNAPAQNNLGAMYFRGAGALQDYVLAHKWWNLSASVGNDLARQNREKLAQSMTAAQIAEAQGLARAWLEEHGQ